MMGLLMGLFFKNWLWEARGNGVSWGTDGVYLP